MESMTRFAVYYAPEPAHPLWDAGCSWLGRDPHRPDRQLPPRESTGEPRRYGFHATLKSPMHLRPDATPDQFVEAVSALAARTARFAMPSLEVGTLGRFIALRPAVDLAASHPLRRLADACVRDLDPWRAMPPADALQCRCSDRSLSPTQKEFLRQWGYPHVFDHWRFHMTLSDDFPEDDEASADRMRHLQAQARRHFADALAQPLGCDSLCIFCEPAPGAPFLLSHRIALAP